MCLVATVGPHMLRVSLDEVTGEKSCFSTNSDRDLRT